MTEPTMLEQESLGGDRPAYEPPVVRDLGKVAEVTRGTGPPGPDTLGVSLV